MGDSKHLYKNAIGFDEAVKRSEAAEALPVQGQMLRESTSNTDFVWATAVSRLGSEALKFAMNAATDILPHNSNLAKWHCGTSSDLYKLCGEKQIVSGTTCNCGAEGRAHKKDCPMNTRNRYPGRALFPSPGRDIESCPIPTGDLEPPVEKCTSRESLKPPAAKKRKSKMKVGDYVCIHSGLLGDCHIPCRIVRDFGTRYQLFCSKGVLITSFSASELLIPLSKCRSIPLDK